MLFYFSFFSLFICPQPVQLIAADPARPDNGDHSLKAGSSST